MRTRHQHRAGTECNNSRFDRLMQCKLRAERAATTPAMRAAQSGWMKGTSPRPMAD
jgi:hypothetical protein